MKWTASALFRMIRMHACLSRLVGKSIATSQLAFVCNWTQKLAQSSKEMKLHPRNLGEDYRPAIGIGDHLQTTLGGVNQKRWSACQKTWSAGQFLLLVSVFSATKAREREGKVFSTYVCPTTLPIITGALGSVVLNPCANNHISWCMLTEESNCTT